ncbi:MAG TPA: Wzz/FepE/Etk N-terminal domain-containing protein [Streptosporangiaceae bacterium]|jgi:capsular polysaccharide biosynthesis protein|nr:Wzz/FepE/Etk N-terminal domain-containing protein [Streptosporangiaceae bacterium]
MTPQAAPDYFELSDYTTVLRRRWRRIVLVTLAGVALTAAYVFVAPKTYTATVLVQVNALPNNANAVGGRTGGPVNMDNEAQAVRSLTVANLVKKRLRSSLSATDISNNIRVSVPPNSTYLQITCAASSAIAAQRCANIVGSAYLDNRRVTIMKLLGTGITTLQQDATRLSQKIVVFKTLLLTLRHQHPNQVIGSKTQISDELQLAGLQTTLQQVQANISTAEPLHASLSDSNGTIVGQIKSPATVPTSPSSPRKLLYIPSGLIAGLVIGLAWAFVRDRRDRRVHSVRDVEHLGDLPTLLSLIDKQHGRVTGLESPRSVAGRAFSELARYVDAAFGEGNHVIAVAATSSGSAGSVVAVNLAAALARTSDRTVLICADLHGTTAPELLGVSRGRGLSEVLTGAARVSEVAAPTGDLPRLRVITPGIDASRAVLAMQQAKLKRLFSDVMDDARYVVIEVQSLGENSDAFGLAQFAEAAVVAVEVERSSRDDIVDCVRRLSRLRTPLLGTVVLRRGGGGMRRARSDAPVRAPYAGAVVSPEPEPDPVFDGGMQASGPAHWTPGVPKVSGSTSDYSSAPAPRGIRETRPLPRVTASERDRYPGSPDPASGD